MSLRKKGRRKGSTYPSSHPIFQEMTEKYCMNNNAGCALPAKRKTNPARCDAAVKTALSQVDSMQAAKPISRISDEKYGTKWLRRKDVEYIGKRRPNYFITLSMKPCVDDNWHQYDRDFYVAKLSKRSAVLVYTLFTTLDPELKNVPYPKWPFFIGCVEHFDSEGDLVAPHIHILLKASVDLETLTDLVKLLWKRAVADAGETGADVQVIHPGDVSTRAAYILKDAHQDGFDILENGVRPERICRNYRWSNAAIAHDKWRLTRETMHQLKNAKHPVLREANPKRRMNCSINNRFRDESEEFREFIRLIMKVITHHIDSDK